MPYPGLEDGYCTTSTLLIKKPHGIDVVEIDGNTYALVASSAESGIQIVDITDPTSIQAVSYIRDPPAGTDFVSDVSVVQIRILHICVSLVSCYKLSLYHKHYNPGITRICLHSNRY